MAAFGTPWVKALERLRRDVGNRPAVGASQPAAGSAKTDPASDQPSGQSAHPVKP